MYTCSRCFGIDIRIVWGISHCLNCGHVWKTEDEVQPPERVWKNILAHITDPSIDRNIKNLEDLWNNTHQRPQ